MVMAQGEALRLMQDISGYFLHLQVQGQGQEDILEMLTASRVIERELQDHDIEGIGHARVLFRQMLTLQRKEKLRDVKRATYENGQDTLVDQWMNKVAKGNFQVMDVASRGLLLATSFGAIRAKWSCRVWMN
jgi:hypothetical protein